MIRMEGRRTGSSGSPRPPTNATSGISANAEVDRARQRHSGEHVVEVLGGRSAGADAGDEAAVLLHVVGDLFRVEGDRDVEVGESDDEQEVQQHVQRVVAAR